MGVHFVLSVMHLNLHVTTQYGGGGYLLSEHELDVGMFGYYIRLMELLILDWRVGIPCSLVFVPVA
jgi:hypothetical protein